MLESEAPLLPSKNASHQSRYFRIFLSMLLLGFVMTTWRKAESSPQAAEKMVSSAEMAVSELETKVGPKKSIISQDSSSSISSKGTQGSGISLECTCPSFPPDNDSEDEMCEDPTAGTCTEEDDCQPPRRHCVLPQLGTADIDMAWDAKLPENFYRPEERKDPFLSDCSSYLTPTICADVEMPDDVTIKITLKAINQGDVDTAVTKVRQHGLRLESFDVTLQVKAEQSTRCDPPANPEKYNLCAAGQAAAKAELEELSEQAVQKNPLPSFQGIEALTNTDQFKAWKSIEESCWYQSEERNTCAQAKGVFTELAGGPVNYQSVPTCTFEKEPEQYTTNCMSCWFDANLDTTQTQLWLVYSDAEGVYPTHYYAIETFGGQGVIYASWVTNDPDMDHLVDWKDPTQEGAPTIKVGKIFGWSLRYWMGAIAMDSQAQVAGGRWINNDRNAQVNPVRDAYGKAQSLSLAKIRKVLDATFSTFQVDKAHSAAEQIAVLGGVASIPDEKTTLTIQMLTL